MSSFGNCNNYIGTYLPQTGEYLFQTGGGATSIVFMLLLCCCSAVCAYSMRTKCSDKKSVVYWINSKWWMWIISFVFPPLLILKIVLWMTCSMATIA